MASKRKNRQSKKLLTATEQVQVVLNAIRKAGGDVLTFFRRAAETLSATNVKLEREVAKFKRVMEEGIDKHRGFKVARFVLDFAKQTLEPATPKTHGNPKTVMRRAPAYA